MRRHGRGEGGGGGSGGERAEGGGLLLLAFHTHGPPVTTERDI